MSRRGSTFSYTEGMFRTPYRLFRTLAILEAVSWTLLLLARYGKPKGPRRVLPKISQEVLAEMVGTTRSRGNFFMNKFRKLGFIEYDGGVTVHDSLLSVVLHEQPAADR